MLVPNRHQSTDDYRYGFNGKELDNELKGEGNSYDFGARMLDPRVGRWFARDALEKSYPDTSPYVFVLNTPVRAKDHDGDVVIFINGQHGGTGGTSSYWSGYNSKVMNKIGDYSARYVDGALGGWKNTGGVAAGGFIAGAGIGGITAIGGAVLTTLTGSNVNRKIRIAAGKVQGMKDAADIIANLKEGETIKIVTHSMGTGFARGYTEGILKYAKAHGLADKVKFEYELDVNSFQGADLPADKNVKLNQNKTGGLDGGSIPAILSGTMSVPTVAPVPGAQDYKDPADADKGHDIGKMSVSDIPKLGNAGNTGSVEQGSNNENKPK